MSYIIVLRQEGGKLNYIEQRELYQFTKDRGSSNNVSNDTCAVPAFAKTLPNYCQTCTEYEARPITDPLKGTQMAESVDLHDHPSTLKDVPEPTNSKLKVAESVASKCAEQSDNRAQYQSVYSSDSRLSSISASAQSSPTALSSSSQITSESQSNILSPCASSSAVMQVDNVLFGEGSGPNQHVPGPLMVSDSGSYTLSHPSTQLYLQQGFTAESHPGHQCSSAISTMDFNLSAAAILHAASGVDAIPHSATLTPFWNPNFIPQAPLSHFNPENSSSFDGSNTTISSPYQVLDTPIFPGNSISGSMPGPGTAHNVNSLGSIRAGDSPVQQPVGATTMYNTSLSMLASVTDPAIRVDSQVYFQAPHP